MRVASALVAALSVLALPLLGAGPAAAETWRTTDATGDVTQLGIGDCPPRCVQTVELVDRPRADLTGLEVTYLKELLRFKVGARVGDPGAEPRVALLFAVRAPEDSLFEAAVIFREGRDPRVLFVDLGAGDEARAARCAGTAAAVQRRRWRLDVPAVCLGTPAWVRIGAYSVLLEKASRDDSPIVIDDALVDGKTHGFGAELSQRISRD